MNIARMILLVILGLVIGHFWGVYQYKNPRWDKKELLGLTEAQAIQILGLPDDKFPVKATLLWIDYNSKKVLEVHLDEQNKVTNVIILNVIPFLDEDMKYSFSAKRLLDISNKCKLIGYTYETTCESSKEKKEKFYRELHLKEKSDVQ